MPRPLVILGTGGSAHDALDIVEAINAATPTWKVVGFLDDAKPPRTGHLGLEILGSLSVAPQFPESWSFINVIGSDRTYRRRPEIIALTGLGPHRFATLVHPAASVSSRARIGRGVCINFGVSIGGGATIGDHVLLCPRVIVGHDAVIEEFAILAPGSIVSGLVRLGYASYLGAGAVVRQKVKIGEKALMGIGAVVVRDVRDGDVVVGNPARPMSGKPGKVGTP